MFCYFLGRVVWLTWNQSNHCQSIPIHEPNPPFHTVRSQRCWNHTVIIVSMQNRFGATSSPSWVRIEAHRTFLPNPFSPSLFYQNLPNPNLRNSSPNSHLLKTQIVFFFLQIHCHRICNPLLFPNHGEAWDQTQHWENWERKRRYRTHRNRSLSSARVLRLHSKSCDFLLIGLFQNLILIHLFLRMMDIQIFILINSNDNGNVEVTVSDDEMRLGIRNFVVSS